MQIRSKACRHGRIQYKNREIQKGTNQDFEIAQNCTTSLIIHVCRLHSNFLTTGTHCALCMRGPMLCQKKEEEEEEETTRKPGTVAASDPDKAKGSQPHVVHIHPPAILYSVPPRCGTVTVSPLKTGSSAPAVPHVVVPQISRVDISARRALPRKIILFALLKSSPRCDVRNSATTTVRGPNICTQCTLLHAQNTPPDIILCVQGC